MISRGTVNSEGDRADLDLQLMHAVQTSIERSRVSISSPDHHLGTRLVLPGTYGVNLYLRMA